MGIFGKLGAALGLYEYEEYTPDDDETTTVGYDKRESKEMSMSYAKPQTSFTTPFPQPEHLGFDTDKSFDYSGTKPFMKGSPKVMNFNSGDQIKMIVINPDSYDEARDICDYIRSKRPVVVNLENMDYEIAQRVMDFLSGSCYSLNGNIQRVAKNIFIIAPDNIDVTSDFKSDIKGKGTQLPWMNFSTKQSTGTSLRG